MTDNTSDIAEKPNNANDASNVNNANNANNASSESIGASSSEVRQRRREKILASREDRLAKIMSMASGRTVDPSEVKLEPLRVTPSPTISEQEGAGVGLEESSEEMPLIRDTEPIPSTFLNDESKHILLIFLSAIGTIMWHYYVNIVGNPYIAPTAGSPFLMFAGCFSTVEAIEFFSKRVSLRQLPSDLALFLFVVVMACKLIPLQ